LPAARIEIDGAIAAVSFVVANGRIVQIYIIANPEKLTRLDKVVDLSRG